MCDSRAALLSRGTITLPSLTSTQPTQYAVSTGGESLACSQATLIHPSSASPLSTRASPVAAPRDAAGAGATESCKHVQVAPLSAAAVSASTAVCRSELLDIPTAGSAYGSAAAPKELAYHWLYRYRPSGFVRRSATACALDPAACASVCSSNLIRLLPIGSKCSA